MAIFAPSESPAVITREIDLTGIVPNVQTSTGVFVGNFRWGPVDQPTYTDNEARIVDLFATPDTNNSLDFHSAAYFSKYSGTLLLIRAIDSNAANAFDSDTPASAPVVRNRANFEDQVGALDSDGHTFIAKYPGELGNDIQIQICPFDSSESTFDNWNYRLYFDGPPSTSDYAADRNAQHDEVHVAIIDRKGKFSGTIGGILETYPYVSLAPNAKNADGSTNYIYNILNSASRYVWGVGFNSDYTVANAGVDIDSGLDYALGSPDIFIKNLSGGTNSGRLTADEYAFAFDLIEDVDDYQVDLLIAPSLPATAEAITIVNDMVSIAAQTRKDCIVITSPPKSDVINTTQPVVDTIDFAKRLTSSSYLVIDNNWLRIFDKYNDEFIYIPAASSTAGLMAQTDYNRAPWWSPAGLRRGIYFGVTSLAYSPNKSDRDSLYKNGVNPITNLPGNGITLFGDKTHLLRPSAFDRINVRRLFLALERAISRAAKQILFEFNDEFTRAEFVNIVEPFLREVKGRRGITDFRVVCDETNNTPEIIDRNEFVASIFIKPARSINYITLNFVAVRTGVDFEEVVGLQF